MAYVGVMRVMYPPKIKEKGLEGSLLKIAGIPEFPSTLCDLIGDTAARVGNTTVLSYGINAPINSFYGNIGGYRMDYEKAMGFLQVAIENVCVLHCEELEISAVHFDAELRKLGVTSKKKSLLEADSEDVEFARKFVRTASFWRKHGGRNTWQADSTTLRYILDKHGDDLPQVFKAISDTRSISAPFVAAMDSVPTPLVLGAL